MAEKKKNSSNLIFDIVFNIVLPVIVLSKFTTEDKLGPVYGLIVALSFPTLYFIYDFIKERKANFISIIGFVSILLTGIIGVFEFPSEWIAVKEASVPLIIGLAVLISLKTPFPLVKKLIYNDSLLDIDLIENKLEEKNNKERLEKCLVNSTYLLSLSFIVSSALNFGLAKYLIKSPSGTEAFTQELARMTALSYPVIALPSTIVMMIALWYLINSIKKLTGLELDDLLSPELKEKNK